MHDGELVLEGVVDVAAVRDRENARLRELAQKAVAANTRRAYATDWDSFGSWALARGLVPLPADPDTVARYIVWLADRPAARIDVGYTRADGRRIARWRTAGPAKPSTITRHLVSVGKAHRAAGYTDPTRELTVQTVAKGLRNERGTSPRKKAAFVRDKLVMAIAAPQAPLPAELTPALRARRERAAALAQARDQAILLLGWSGAFRRSEIAAIDVAHLGREPEGIDIVIPSSKTNQQGEHESVLIPYGEDEQLCPIRALDAWLTRAGITEGAVFRQIDRHGRILGRIQPAVVATVTKAFARAAQLDPDLFAAHSLRSGWISSAASEDRGEREMMRHSRHRSVGVFRGYVQQATKWRRHPGIGLL